MKNVLKKCNLCARNCQVNRYQEVGYCKQTNKIRIAKAAITYFEEPCISGKRGSGTIFFSGCNMGCIFCQNREISTQNFGVNVTIKRLAEIMLELEAKGASNINLVTPTMHVVGIKKALKLAKQKGLKIPIIYNTSSYETKETIQSLASLIDVYLPDLKYFNDSYAIKYSNAKNYFQIATTAIMEMYKQVPKVEFDQNGYIKKGVIIRHLMLPTLKNDTKKILEYLYNTYHDNVYISIMNQYTVMDKFEYEELNHGIKKRDYEEIIDYALSLGITNAFCQLDDTSSKKFIPKFDLNGVKKTYR